MECDCTVFADVENQNTHMFSEAESRKARKEHKCSECGRIIITGEQYIYDSGVWEGEVGTYKTCQDCKSIRDVFFRDGWYFTMLWEELNNHLWEVDEVSASCMLGLTKDARDKVCDILDENSEEKHENSEYRKSTV